MPSFYDPLIRYIYLDASKGYLQVSFAFLELFIFKVEKIKEVSLDSIPSPSVKT